MSACPGGVHGFQDSAQCLVTAEGFQHQQAAEHHDLEGPLIEAGEGEGHGCEGELDSPSARQPRTLVMRL